jgi:hypothetical protein
MHTCMCTVHVKLHVCIYMYVLYVCMYNIIYVVYPLTNTCNAKYNNLKKKTIFYRLLALGLLSQLI